jgi:hypothetical protein
MTASRTSSARGARLLKFKSVAITHLKQQIAAYRTSIKKQCQKITDLEDELELSRALIAIRSDSIPDDIIFGDLYHNRNGKMPAKFAVNRNYIRGKLTENHRKL